MASTILAIKRYWQTMSPGARFAVPVSIAALLFALLGAALAWRIYAGERDHEIDFVRQTAATAGANADAFLRDRLDILTAISYAPPIREQDQAGMQVYFDSLDPEGMRFADGIGWIDRNGWVQAYSNIDPATIPLYLGDRAYVQEVLNGQMPFVGGAVVGRTSANPILPLAVPTYDAAGQFSGLVFGTIRLDLLETAAKAQRFAAGDVTIVDRDGNVIVHPGVFTDIRSVAGSPLLAKIKDLPPGVLSGAEGLDGAKERIIGYSSAPAGGWTVLVDRSESGLYGEAGRTFLIEVGALVLVVAGIWTGAIGIGRRINVAATREQGVRRALEIREARLRALTEATTQVIWTASPDGEQRDQEKRWSMLTGLPESEIDRNAWLPYVRKEDREPGDMLWRRGIATGEMIEFEQRVRRADGAERNVLVRVVPVREPDGGIREWIGVDIDVTEQRHAEEALRQSEAAARETADRLSLALEAGHLNTWDWDIRNDAIVWSASSNELLGPTPNRIDLFLASIHEDDRNAVRESIRRSIDEQAPYEVEYRTYDIDGRQRWLYVRGEAFHDAAGAPLRMLGVDVDVTDRKNREVFEQDFVANVAHDIKNPLAAVKAQTQLLRRRIKNGKFDPASIDTVLGVLDAGLTRMNRRIEELADVARLRAGRQLELRKELVSLVAMTQSLIDAYQQSTERHTLTLTSAEPEIAGLLDSGRIERVLDNLVSNAVKYSPDGGAVSIEIARADDQPGAVQITVIDHGIGIPAADLPHIFDRYRRAGNTAVITGTGIGLAGSRQIVEQHGGRIDVVSQEGVGSRFTVTLPLSGMEARGVSRASEPVATA